MINKILLAATALSAPNFPMFPEPEVFYSGYNNLELVCHICGGNHVPTRKSGFPYHTKKSPKKPNPDHSWRTYIKERKKDEKISTLS